MHPDIRLLERGLRPSGSAVITLLGSEIGRGHPFYLDGLRAALDRRGARVERDENVFTV